LSITSTNRVVPGSTVSAPGISSPGPDPARPKTRCSVPFAPHTAIVRPRSLV
jgi:hypothetical protein